MLFVVDLWLDGVSEDEDGPEMEAACKQFIEEQLDFSASGVKVRRLREEEIEHIDDFETHFPVL